MHLEAYDAVGRLVTMSGFESSPRHIADEGPYLGLDIGGRNINGSAREWLPDVEWTGFDIADGPDVDFVGDATLGMPPIMNYYDIVLCTEVFEHVMNWRGIVQTMWNALRLHGVGMVVITCASLGRPMHGASGEPAPPPGEWYGNVSAEDIRVELNKYFASVHVEYNTNPGDAYALARDPRTIVTL